MLATVMTKRLRILAFAAMLVTAAPLSSQDYQQDWNVPDIANPIFPTPLVTGGNVFGADVIDKSVKDRELLITIDDTTNANSSNPFIAGYFQEFDPANCSAVRDLTGKTLSMNVYQIPVIVNMVEVLNAAPQTSHFAFQVAFDTNGNGTFDDNGEDAIYRTNLNNDPFILPGTDGDTFTIKLNAENFPVLDQGPVDSSFDLKKVVRISFLILQDIAGEGAGGSTSATFPDAVQYAWKFDNLSVCGEIESGSGVLFHDDFDGASLDKCKWNVATNTIGRTQFGKEPDLAAGVATMRFDTYNEMDPGTTFLATEIGTACKFKRGTGLEFETRIRVPEPIANGLVVAFFTFGFDDNIDRSDEIDLELLSNWINNPSFYNKVLVASYNDFNETNPLSEQQYSASLAVNNLDTATFNTYKVRLFSDRTEWYVNNQLVLTDSTVVPNDPMNIRLNIWAPSVGFADAYDGSLQPANLPESNQSYSVEVDYLTVIRITDPGTTPVIPTLPEWGVIILTLALVFVAFLRLRREGFSPTS